MPAPPQTTTVAVIVGRFQVPTLHEGHRSLFGQAFAECDEVLVLLGTPYMTSERDPLDFILRKMMIEGAFRGYGKPLRVVESPSLPSSNEARSHILDALIARECAGKRPVIYGSGDSIVHAYKGAFETRETDTITERRGTQIREAIEPVDSEDFRAGAIYGRREQKPLFYPTVDIAIVSGNLGQVLLVSKSEDEGLWRFPGAFFNPELDKSFEATALRCVGKEVPGVHIGSPHPVTSRRLEDPRFKRTHDGVVTLLMRANANVTQPTPAADIERAAWMPMWFTSTPDFIVPVHQPLAEIMLTHWAG